MENIDDITFDIPLDPSNDEQASFKFRNTSLYQFHREHVTGSDKKGTNVVRGRLVHVVHGFKSAAFPSKLRADQCIPKLYLANGDTTPCTLIVIEWTMIPDSTETRNRFRSVDIKLVFAASHFRVGVPEGGDISQWDPVPKETMPTEKNPNRVGLTSVDASVSKGWTAGASAGYQGYLSVNGERNKGKSLQFKYETSSLLKGEIGHDEKTCGEPNAVKFTFLEDPTTKRGVPLVVRTAIVVQRLKRDVKGKFAMTVDVSTNVHWLEGIKEDWRRVVGGRWRDDPVYFDPGASYMVKDGARVERNDFIMDGVDWCRLNDVDLRQFMVGYVKPSPIKKEEKAAPIKREAEEDMVSDASNEGEVWEDAKEFL